MSETTAEELPIDSKGVDLQTRTIAAVAVLMVVAVLVKILLGGREDAEQDVDELVEVLADMVEPA